MLYLGLFRFRSMPSSRQEGASLARLLHGQLLAPDANVASRKLDALIRKTAATSELLSDVPEIYSSRASSCVRARRVSRMLPCRKGESIGSISTTLPDVGGRMRARTPTEPDAIPPTTRRSGQFFIVLKPEVVEAPAPKASPSHESPQRRRRRSANDRR